MTLTIARRGCARLLPCVLAAAVAQPLSAFTYEEHCQASNDALALATRYALSTPELAAALNPVHVERLRRLSKGPCNPRSPETYGDFVALADYALTPVEYYAYVPNRHTPLVFSDDELPWSSIEAMGNWRLQNLRSAHINEDHFEERALLSQFIWHETAIHFSAARRQLVTALLLNAFADHFLQDFFAPGHIHTPRRRLHDVTALGRHDDINRKGERYYPANVEDLVPLLRLAPPSIAAACAGERPAPCLCALQDSGFVAGGDGRLGELRTQRMFVVLVTARSILDVLESFARSVAQSSFRTAKWHESEYVDTIAEYTLSDGTRRRVVERYRRSAAAGISYGEFRAEWALNVVELAVGISVGHQAIISHGRESAAVGSVGLEFAMYAADGRPSGPPRRRGEASFRQMGVGLGYTLFYGDGRPMHGLGLRLILPLTEINTQLSVGANARRQSLQSLTWGVHAMAEMGFGVAFLGVGVGSEWESRLTADKHRWVITSSISVSAPMSSVGRVGGLRRRR